MVQTLTERFEDTPATTPEIMLPWSNWTDPEVFTTDIHALQAGIEGNEITFAIRSGEGDAQQFSSVSQTALKELSTRIGFPTEFISKLSPELRPLVINDRIQSTRDQRFSFVSDGDGRIVSASPGQRETISHREIAQLGYDALLSSSEVETVTVDRISRNDGRMDLLLMTPVQTPITRRVGDILQLGVSIVHSFANDLTASLFTRRLICLNGMTTAKQEYQWNSNLSKTREAQIEWFRDSILRAVDQYDVLIARATHMSETEVHGDMTSALYQRARSMGVPTRLIPQILEAFNQEPGNTEWHLINAITRFATHHADREMGSRLQLQSGHMVENWIMATARLPLFMAQVNGFEILSTEDRQSA